MITANASLDKFTRGDPTRSQELRRRYGGAIRKRLRSVRGLVRTAILENNSLQLDRIVGNIDQSDLNPDESFRFTRRDDMDKAFKRWLQRQLDNELLEVSRGGGPSSQILEKTGWEETYIRRAYVKGVNQADEKLAAVGQVEAEAGRQTAQQLFNQPIHAEKIKNLFTRNFAALKTVRNAVVEGSDGLGIEGAAKAFREELSGGLAQGKNPRDIGRAIVNRVNGNIQKITNTQANMVARTEVINSHAEATLNRYQQQGIQKVQGQTEFMATADSRTCPLCLSLQGRRFSLQDSRGVIPVHVMCRCTWVPVTRFSDPLDEKNQFARDRFKEIGMEPEDINALKPDDPLTKEALSRFGKLRRGTLDLDDEELPTPGL